MVWATPGMASDPPRPGALITVILPLSLNIWGPSHCIGYGESFSPNYFWATSTDGLNCCNFGTMIMFKIREELLFCVQEGRLAYPCIRAKFFNRLCEKYGFLPLKGKRRSVLGNSSQKVCWGRRKDIQNQGGWDSMGTLSEAEKVANHRRTVGPDEVISVLTVA